jgi:Site-specific recombinase XerD
MKVFLRCKCGERDKRAAGCKHCWAAQFKFKGGNPIPVQTPHTNKLDAERYADKVRTHWIKRETGDPYDREFMALHEGKPLTTGGLQVIQCRDQYREACRQEITAETRDRYLRIHNTFIAVVGADTLMHTLTPADVHRWRMERVDSGVSRDTVNSELAGVRVLFKHAGLSHTIFGKTALVNGQKVAGIRNWEPQKKERKHRPLTAEEQAQAYACLPHPYDIIARVTREVTARLSEVFPLQRRHVGIATDADGTQYGWVTKKLKGGDGDRSTIPLDLAKTLMALASKSDALLFPTVYNPARTLMQNSKRISDNFCNYFKRIGLQCSHHAFRHTAITAMMDRGNVSDLTIAQHAGWKSTRQIPTYGHVSKTASRLAVDGNAAEVAAILKNVKRTPLTTKPQKRKVAA